MLQSLKENAAKTDKKNADLPVLKKKERKSLKKAYKQELVRRSAINRIVASWLITVPLSAIFGAVTFYLISKVDIPL